MASALQGQRLCATVKTRGTVWTVQTQACMEGLCLEQRAAVPFAVAGHVDAGLAAADDVTRTKAFRAVWVRS